ncbi:MAG: hypothetical protein Q7T55_14205 [Solirubrobacteraceae bacterium]|nr:hypothetical protein [Solirubrobacteraceae bacterium]
MTTRCLRTGTPGLPRSAAVHSSGTPRRDRAFLAVLALLLAIGVITAVTRGGGNPQKTSAQKPADAAEGASGDAGSAAMAALRYQAGDDDQYAERAAAGFSHPLYAAVPGGAVATAKRVAAWRGEIEKAASVDDSPVDADTLEALVYLESAGRPNASATGKISGAIGLTQIVGGTANDLLGMNVDLARSQDYTDELAKVTKQIARWDARGSTVAATRGRKRLEALRIARAKTDGRFVPATALAATVRYLEIAKDKLGREDLALTSYHMGIGNLQNVLAAYGRKSVSYVQLYFDVDPKRAPKAYRILSQFQDDSATYYWRILAAKSIMKQYREDAGALAATAKLVTSKASREDLMHPPDANPGFKDGDALQEAEDDGELIPLPIAALNANGVAVSPAMGELAGRLKAPRSRYRALRRGSLATLVTIGAAVKDLTGGKKVLVATSSVRDLGYQSLLQSETVQATHAYSLHTSGWAVDVSRSYASTRQAQMFQFVLTRMQALNLISFVKEPEAIHFTAADDTEARLGPILEVALGRS